MADLETGPRSVTTPYPGDRNILLLLNQNGQSGQLLKCQLTTWTTLKNDHRQSRPFQFAVDGVT